MSTELVRYDAMCSAITACHAVDEVLGIKDKARALEVYARQVKNTEAERKACDVRLRAERRVGELLKELTRGDAGRPASVINGEIVRTIGIIKSPYAQALADNAISTQSASRYQQLADVPKADFEQALADPMVKPSTTRLIAEIRDPVPSINVHALWLWGRLRDFERDGYDDMDSTTLVASMTEAMRADVRRIAPRMAGFLMGLIQTEVQYEDSTA